MSLSSALLIRVPFLGEVVFMLQVFSTSPCSSRRAGISFEIWPWSLTPACSEISRLLGPTYIEGFTVSPEDCKPLVLNRTASITFHCETTSIPLTLHSLSLSPKTVYKTRAPALTRRLRSDSTRVLGTVGLRPPGFIPVVEGCTAARMATRPSFTKEQGSDANGNPVPFAETDRDRPTASEVQTAFPSAVLHSPAG